MSPAFHIQGLKHRVIANGQMKHLKPLLERSDGDNLLVGWQCGRDEIDLFQIQILAVAVTCMTQLIKIGKCRIICSIRRTCTVTGFRKRFRPLIHYICFILFFTHCFLLLLQLMHFQFPLTAFRSLPAPSPPDIGT